MFHGPDEHFDISLFLNSVWDPHFILDFQQYSDTEVIQIIKFFNNVSAERHIFLTPRHYVRSDFSLRIVKFIIV